MATVTTNTLWTRYLNSLGYSGSLNDMLVQALRFYSGSDRKSLNDLWNIYLTSEGVRGSSVSTKLYNYLGDKGHTAHSLDTRIRQSLIAGDIFSPVPGVCSITLTHDIVDAYPSYLPADIDGNQFSLTFPTPGFDQYAASTSITDLKSLPASGTVWVEFRKSGVPAGVGLQFVDAVSTDTINFIAFGEGFASVSLYEGGSFVGGAQLDSLGEVDSLMVGYNSAGELFVMDQYGVPRNVTEFPVDGIPLPPAPLSGFTAIAFVGAIIGSTELTGTASGQFVTDHEQFPYPPEGEAYDWCGRQIPLLPVYKGGLAQALADAGELDPLEYTSATWSDVESTITAGQLVLDDDEATQLEVNNAIRTITTSVNNLVEWTPAEEFSNGELGTYFDPEDTSTLFQDSAGTTPVTGDGQPVGLMLDKSQGLELGPELVVNGDFSDGDEGWAAIGTNADRWHIADGVATISPSDTISGNLRQLSNFAEEGKMYLVELDVLESNGQGWIGVGHGTDTEVRLELPPAPGRLSAITLSTGANPTIFQIRAAANTEAQITNISVKELPGHHAIQSTTAAKPTYSYVNGLGFDGVDDRLIVGTVDDFIWLHDGSPVTIGLVREVLPNNAQQQITGTAHLGASALIGLAVVSETREGNPRFGYDGFTVAHGETGFYTYRLPSTSVDASGSQVATITYQYDSAIARTYVNGVLGSTAVPEGLTFSDSPSTYPLHIGSSGAGAHLLGNIKALVIYNKHLSPEAFGRFQHWLAKKAGIAL